MWNKYINMFIYFQASIYKNQKTKSKRLDLDHRLEVTRKKQNRKEVY